jgi:hypothetical protein
MGRFVFYMRTIQISFRPLHREVHLTFRFLLAKVDQAEAAC